MITANMHEAKSHLSELVKAVEETGEIVVLKRNGKPVAEIRAITPRPFNRRLIKPDPALRVKLAPGYDPAEPLSDDEWPENWCSTPALCSRSAVDKPPYCRVRFR